MSWEDQGRQFHQWFGHGTGSGADAGAGDGRTGNVAGTVGNAAVAALGGVHGGVLSRVLAEGGAEDLAAALPIWAASAGLAADRFRALVVGPGFGVAGAASLQAMARAVAQSAGGEVAAEHAREAGAHLAAALGGERQVEWGYKLNLARDMAEYAAANWTVPTGAALKTAAGEAGPARADSDPGLAQKVQFAVPVGPAPLPMLPQFVPGTPENGQVGQDILKGLRGVGEAIRRGDFPPSLAGLVMRLLGPLIFPLTPPADAKERDGAKAPGKPSVEEGFEDPKNGEEWVESPNGRGRGWKDANGDVWVPTGKAGAPGTGTTGLAHGGPHWDVQGKDGSFKGNVYPGGSRR